MELAHSPLFASLASAASQFAAWWLGELKALVPAKLRIGLLSPEPDLVVAVGVEAAVVHWPRSKADLGPCALELPSPEPSVFAQLPPPLAGRLKDARRPVIQLNAALGLKKTILLPIAAERGLRGAINYQIERHFPYRLTDADFGYRVVRRDQQHLWADVYVFERQVVDRWLEGMKGRTGAKLILRVFDPGEQSLTPLRISAQRLKTAVRPRVRLTRVLALFAVLLAGLAAYQFYEMRERHAAYLEEQIAAMRLQATASAAVRTRSRQRFDAVGALRSKLELPGFSQIVESLAAELPDDGWLTSLKIGESGIAVGGFAANASGLPALIEAAPLFSHAQFVSAVQRIPSDDVERFELSAKMESGSDVR